MLEKLVKYLNALGLDFNADDYLLTFAVENAEQNILNATNQRKLPKGLTHMAVRMAAGYYLQSLRAVGRLNVEGVDLAAAITQIKEGDTSISFEGASSEQLLDMLITSLMTTDKRELARYRRLVW